MARCLWILRISLGEMYHRFRRASLRIRSFMTSLRNLLSSASCDSPLRKFTDANTSTPFLRQVIRKAQAANCPGQSKTGLLAHSVLGGSRFSTSLAVDLINSSARTLNGALRHSGLNGHLAGVSFVYMATVLLYRIGQPLFACWLVFASHPSTVGISIIADSEPPVKACHSSDEDHATTPFWIAVATLPPTCGSHATTIHGVFRAYRPETNWATTWPT